MQSMKKLFVCFLVLIMTVTALVPAVEADAGTLKIKVSGKTQIYTGKQWKVCYEGETIKLSSTPGLTINYAGYVPFNAVFVKNGPKAQYDFNKHTGVLTLRYGKNSIRMRNNRKTVYVNGKKYILPCAPCYVTYPNGQRLFCIPVKMTCEFLGLKYSYNSKESTIYIDKPVSGDGGTQATVFKKMSSSQFLAKMGPICREDYRKSGVLASVTLAQAILESGWGKSRLAQSANNLFGMKASLSGNKWSGSGWDGRSVYSTTSVYRKYKCIEDSVKDHSSYLRSAKNGSSLRYKGLTSTKSYTKQLQIIRNGGYCSDSTYVAYCCAIIRSYNLTKWDY